MSFCFSTSFFSLSKNTLSRVEDSFVKIKNSPPVTVGTSLRGLIAATAALSSGNELCSCFFFFLNNSKR